MLLLRLPISFYSSDITKYSIFYKTAIKYGKYLSYDGVKWGVFLTVDSIWYFFKKIHWLWLYFDIMGG